MKPSRKINREPIDETVGAYSIKNFDKVTFPLSLIEPNQS
jgi:hypothetical protein